MQQKHRAVARVREFNRFYMPKLDLLGNRYLGSECSAAEARILFEIYQQDGCTASHITRTMNLDKGYLSRVLKAHEKKGYLTKRVSAGDSRCFTLHLTALGREVTEEFIRRSDQQIGAILDALDEDECRRLMAALDEITALLTACTAAGPGSAAPKGVFHEDRTL